jgi:hypothetical protein
MQETPWYSHFVSRRCESQFVCGGWIIIDPGSVRLFLITVNKLKIVVSTNITRSNYNVIRSNTIINLLSIVDKSWFIGEYWLIGA